MSENNQNLAPEIPFENNSISFECRKKSNTIDLQRFLILTKEDNFEAFEVGKSIQSWLQAKGKVALLKKLTSSELEVKEMAKQSDIALVLGGDGTMLGVARTLYDFAIPLLGINFGRVGFLTDISPQNWQNSLEKLLQGGYEIQNCTPLWWELVRGNECIYSGIAVNDVVVARSMVAKAISIGLSVDNVFLSELYCDGLICSAPLGATAYAASAHGPLVFPSLDAHVLTPISPFAGSFPPLVLPRESLVKINTLKGDAVITIDGQVCHSLEFNDVIHVKSASKRISMFVQSQDWFWQRLVERGFIMPGPGKYTR